jgi:hypothetical protein
LKAQCYLLDDTYYVPKRVLLPINTKLTIKSNNDGRWNTKVETDAGYYGWIDKSCLDYDHEKTMSIINNQIECTKYNITIGDGGARYFIKCQSLDHAGEEITRYYILNIFDNNSLEGPLTWDPSYVAESIPPTWREPQGNEWKDIGRQLINKGCGEYYISGNQAKCIDGKGTVRYYDINP